MIKQIQTVTTRKKLKLCNKLNCLLYRVLDFATKAQSASSNDKKGADGLFGEMISHELKQFSASKKGYLKYRIQSLIYESQMGTSEPTNNLRSQSPVANQPNTSIYGSPVFDRNHRENPTFCY